MKISYYSQPNYLTRTAIVREQKQFIKIAFAVHLSAVISAERYRSDSVALKSAVLTLVYFYIIMIVHKCQQSAKRKLLLNKNNLSEVFPLTVGNGKTMAFENRHDGCKEREKINRRRIFDTLRINFFEATPQTACIFSKEYYRYDANGYITAEKDGPFTEKEDFTFTYSYFAEHDVYGVDYGFDLEPPEDDPANLESGGTTSTTPTGGYRRDYIWNERNLLIKSDDKLNTVIYRYGDDGQRALKFTQQSNSETLYFNNFYSIHQVAHEPNHEHGLRVSKHIFVGNSRLVTAMTHADNNGDTTEQTEKRYYYHADHLQSAQFITNAKGEQYEHIEYTPYGELWIEETAPGIDKLPFRFTGKELDEETGLYYYGARYLDPKYSRWLSGDPALNDYIPQAPVNDEAKKHNENLPGMGGVFNTVNLHVYHYAGNNPVKYTDPDGRDIHILTLGGVGAKLVIGGSLNIGIAWDDNGNSALVMTGGFGVGVEAQLHTFLTPSYSVTKGKNIDDLPGIGSTRISFNASLTGTEANVGVGIGINFDMESNEISGINAGIIGGGVNFIGFARFKIIKHGEKSRSAEQLKEIIDTIKNLDSIPDDIKQQILKTIKEMM